MWHIRKVLQLIIRMKNFHYEEEIVKQNLGPEYRQLIAIQAKKLIGGVKDWLHDDLTAAKRISLRNIRLNKAIENHSTDVISECEELQDLNSSAIALYPASVLGSYSDGSFHLALALGNF